MNIMLSVPAIQYEVKIYEGLNDFVHGGGKKIKEIFVPSHQIAFNSEGFFFKSETGRVEGAVKNVQLSPELVEKIAVIVNLQLEVKAKEEKVKSDLTNFWNSQSRK